MKLTRTQHRIAERKVEELDQITKTQVLERAINQPILRRNSQSAAKHGKSIGTVFQNRDTITFGGRPLGQVSLLSFGCDRPVVEVDHTLPPPILPAKVEEPVVTIGPAKKRKTKKKTDKN